LITEVDEQPDIKASYRCKLLPSATDLGRGAHQSASCLWSDSWDERYRGDIVVAVRNTQRWAPTAEILDYALAIVLESELTSDPVYAQLRNHLELLNEVEIEAQF
jgi:hypothetical protein